MKSKSIPFVFLLCVLCSCNTSGSRFALDDIEYITSFDAYDAIVPISKRSVVDLKIDGIRSFKVYGPYIIVSTAHENGQITIFEKQPPYQRVGSFFPKGNGPGELVYPLSPSSFVYHTSEDGTITAELDNKAGKLIRFDITRSITERRTVTETIGETKRTTFEVINLGEDGIFYKDISDTRDAQIRYIVKDGEKIITKSMEKLNAAILKNKEDDGLRFNVLSGSVKYDAATKKFCETPGQINAIHIYSLDDSYAKTFCFGKKLYDYNELADRPQGERRNTSICTRLGNRFLQVLYVDVTKNEYSEGAWKPSLILLPLSGNDDAPRRFQLPDRVDSFDFDIFINGYYTTAANLYALDSATESMYVYDLLD